MGSPVPSASELFANRVAAGHLRSSWSATGSRYTRCRREHQIRYLYTRSAGRLPAGPLSIEVLCDYAFLLELEAGWLIAFCNQITHFAFEACRLEVRHMRLGIQLRSVICLVDCF